MIYEFSRDLQTLLRAQHYPVAVKYGPERIQRETMRGHVVVVERDREGTDTVEAAHGAQANPRKVRARYLAATATIYAQSSLPGAHIGDHERECEKLVDAVICAMYKWGAEAKVGDLPISSAKFVSAVDRNGIEEWPGVAYEIRFKVGRGIFDRAYVGESSAGTARPTGTPTGVQNQTQARLTGSDPDADPEVGCGA